MAAAGFGDLYLGYRLQALRGGFDLKEVLKNVASKPNSFAK